MPHERVLVRALDALCPEGKVMLLGVFEDGALFTAIVARRKGHGFDLLLGPEKLRSEMGLVSGDWRRDYRHLARAAERAAGPLALGCFGELETLRDLRPLPRHRALGPRRWLRGTSFLSPAVPAVALPLGIDVGRAALRRGARPRGAHGSRLMVQLRRAARARAVART